MAAKKATRRMSDEHKAALAKGRAQGRAVREYLLALDQASRPGRKVDASTLEKRRADLERQISDEPDPAKRVELVQRRIDTEERLANLEDQPDVEELEAAFVDAVGEYSERKGISYNAWREVGVPAAVLKQAGVRRTRRTAAGEG